MGLTLWERLTLLPAFGYILGRGVLIALFAPLRTGPARTKDYGVAVQQKLFRVVFNTLSAAQLYWLFGHTIDSYSKFQKSVKKNVVVDKVPGAGIEGAWFGDKDKAKVLMIYCHGGGFAMPAMPQHPPFLTRLVDWCQGDLAVFLPAYTTSSQAVYPQALGEVVEATRFVFEGPGKDKEVILAGDSAGGQLAVAILSHVTGHQHPNSSVVKPLDLKGRKFKAVFLMAPWVSSDYRKFPSMVDLSQTDVLDTSIAEYWANMWKGGKPDDEYIVPEIAPADWWKGVPNVTDDVLITAGNDEALRDGIKSFAAKFEQGAGKERVRLVVAAKESHDQPLNTWGEKFLAKEKPGQEISQEGALKNWIIKQCA